MLNKIIHWLLVLIAFITPLFWLGNSKFVLVSVPLVFLLCVVKALRDKKMVVKFSFFDILVLLLLLVYVLSTIFSLDKYVSLWSLALIFASSLFYWLLRAFLTKKNMEQVFGAFIFSGFIAGGTTLLNFFLAGLGLPTLVNSITSLVAFLVVLLPLAFYLLIKSPSQASRVFYLGFISFAFLMIILINFRFGWILLLTASLVLVFTLIISESNKKFITLPIILAIIASLFLFFSPTGFSLKFPGEITVSKQVSINIAQKTSKESAKALILGSGPGTFVYSFSKFRPEQFSRTALWRLRFTRANNQLVEALSSTGYLGLVALLTLLALALFKVVRQRNRRMLLGAISGIALSTWYLPMPPTLWLLLFAILALEQTSNRKLEFSLENRAWYKLAYSLVLIILAMAVVLWYGFLVKVFVAEFYFSGGEVEQAIKYNPKQPLYHMALAQQRIEQALLLSKAEDATLKKTEIINLLASSINNSSKAVNLSPNNALLLELRAGIFKEARVFGHGLNLGLIEILNKSIELEPGNPLSYMELGVAYDIEGDKVKALLNLKRAVELRPRLPQAQYELGKFYYNNNELTKSLEHLEAAIILRKDYANAMFVLALVYEKLDRVPEALVLLRRVLEFNPDKASLPLIIDRLESL